MTSIRGFPGHIPANARLILYVASFVQFRSASIRKNPIISLHVQRKIDHSDPVQFPGFKQHVSLFYPSTFACTEIMLAMHIT
jgi:hypothetical protein